MIRKRVLAFFLSFFLLLPATVFSAEYIKVASFNIAEFGEGSHPQTRNLDAIAQTLVDAELDLIAIQEMGVKSQAEDQLNKLVNKMNDLAEANQTKYFSYVTPLSGDERYAVIYRSPVIREGEISWLDDDKNDQDPRDGGKIYYRIPVAVPFRAKNFDFVVVIMHLAWGNLDRRKAEVGALRKFLMDKDSSEDDWIVLGDMNRYGKQNKSTPNKPFDQLLKGNWKSRYRFPLLEAITEPDDMKIYRAKKDEESTTVAQSKNIYDQFIITQGAYREFETNNPRIGDHVGIIAFDMDHPFSTINDHNLVKYQFSDHRPLWIRLRIDLPDDD